MRSFRFSAYTAILIDSFHAALASRVLWCAFVAIWLLLLALAPIGYREDLTTDFRWQDFAAGTKLKAMLATGLVQPEQTGPAVAKIANALPDDLKDQLRQVGEGSEVRIPLSDFADAFNDLLDDPSWYDPVAWQDLLAPFELIKRQQSNPDDWTKSERRRVARLRLETALPGVFEARSAQSILMTYAGFDFPASFTIDQRQFKALINQFVLPQLINLLLGFVLVFLGILVTASLIPDLLQPGSLHLLLSKPISRPMLFLTKFLGGCAFVFLCVVQLVIGLWLIAGLRLDIWNARLLWCIPVSVFLFSVFYSVSVLAGLRWRSPILSIGVTCMFGAIVFVVGFVGGLFDGLVRRPDEVIAVTVDQDDIIVKTRGQGLQRYDGDSNQWVDIVESQAMGRDRVLSPVSMDEGTIASARISGGRFNAFGAGTLDLLVFRRRNDWEPERLARLPVSTVDLRSDRAGHLYAKNMGDLFVADIDAIVDDEAQTADDAEAESSMTNWLSKLLSMQGAGTERFRSIIPAKASVASPSEFAVADDGRSLWLISAGRIFKLEKPSASTNGPWDLDASTEAEGEASADARIAISGNVLLVSRLNEPLQFFDARDLTPIKAQHAQGLQPEWDLVKVIGLETQNDGRIQFAFVNADAQAGLIEVDIVGDEPTFKTQTFPFREVVSISRIDQPNQVILSHHIDQLEWIDLRTMQSTKAVRPNMSTWRLVDRYVITPLRTIIPQTGELGGTVAAIIGGSDTAEIPGGPNRDDEQVVRYPIVRPVVSCAAFTLVMLTIGCVYFSRSDY
ncbi:ABC transporter permease [Crateriforma conspicua]|uniref:ABC transporter permease n=1 Tax=Crateriforma conspicua TaxID=2527996 RepID=UPI00118C05BD|nr:ABC transporter permease [Crateriforma conspicua]QDV64900.1 ABC-2 family transporter protein [Crateriforma conspicua]